VKELVWSPPEEEDLLSMRLSHLPEKALVNADYVAINDVRKEIYP